VVFIFDSICVFYYNYLFTHLNHSCIPGMNPNWSCYIFDVLLNLVCKCFNEKFCIYTHQGCYSFFSCSFLSFSIFPFDFTSECLSLCWISHQLLNFLLFCLYVYLLTYQTGGTGFLTQDLTLPRQVIQVLN
jgi:hypothetical protein